MNARPESFRPHHDLETLRVPPQSVEAEQAVLGGLMLAPERFAEAQDLLTEADFYRRDHRLIYRAIVELEGKRKPYDAVTLGDWLEANGLADEVGGSSYLIDLASTTPSAANLRAYAEIVREKSVQRGLIEAGTEIVNDGFEPDGRESTELLSKAQARLAELGADRGRGGFELPRPALRTLFRRLQDRWNADEWLTGLSTPFPNFDEVTLGLPPGDLIIVAARPGMGKSILGGDVATHVAEQQLLIEQAKRGAVALYSLEMSREQLWQRQIASKGRVPHEWLRSPKAWERKHESVDSDAFWGAVSATIKVLDKLPLHIDDTGRLNIDQIIARARRLHRQQPLKLIGVDHLHIIARPGKDTVTELGTISSKLKALAKETGACVLALAQLNRAMKDRPDKRPNIADLRASGELEQDADEIWFLHREDYYDRKTHLKGVVELINGKSRNAPAGETVYLRNRFDQMRLEAWEGPLPEREMEDQPRRRGFRKSATDGKAAAGGGDE
jgi:replicative DNA helicase